MRLVRAFIKRDFLLETSYRATFAVQLLSIVFGVAIFHFMGDVFRTGESSQLKKYGGNFFAFVLIGVAFTDYLAVSLKALNRTIQESQMMGTLEILLLSPYEFPTMMVCTTLWPYLFSSLRFMLYLLSGVIFGVHVEWRGAPVALLLMFLSIISFAALGAIVGSFTLVFKRGVPINTVIIAASILLGGVAYPVEVLPHWLAALSKYLPITHAISGMRKALLQGLSPSEVVGEFAALAVFALVLVPVALASIRLAVKRTKMTGTLSHY